MKSCFGSQRHCCAAVAAELRRSSDHGGWSLAVVNLKPRMFLLEMDNESLTQQIKPGCKRARTEDAGFHVNRMKT